MNSCSRSIAASKQYSEGHETSQTMSKNLLEDRYPGTRVPVEPWIVGQVDISTQPCTQKSAPSLQRGNPREADPRRAPICFKYLDTRSIKYVYRH